MNTSTLMIILDYSHILFWLLSWQRFLSTRTSIFGFNLSAETNLTVACKCSSVRRDHNTVLLSFIDEKNCSHTCVLPNIAIILAAAESTLWKFFSWKKCVEFWYFYLCILLLQDSITLKFH